MGWFAKCKTCKKKTKFPTGKGSILNCVKCDKPKSVKMNTNIYDYKYDEPLK